MKIFGMGIAIALAAIVPPTNALAYTPTTAYKQESLQGFTILINPAVLAHPQEAQAMRQELGAQLAKINQVVPVRPLALLKSVRIWVEWVQPPNQGATFHPSAVWLQTHGFNPAKAGCVELSNTHNFVQWSRTSQPWMVLHELSHGYNFLGLGEHYPPLEAAYNHAVAQKLYQSVPYILGGKQRAYALTNAKEYFAELSEAYFGKNDFYPFTRQELQQYDPLGYQLMETAWGQPRGTIPAH